MRRLLAAGLLAGFLPLAGFSVASAQETLNPAAGEETTATISGPDEIEVGHTLILDASASRVGGEKPEYRWYLEDPRQPISRSVEAIYTPESTGLLVFHLTVRSIALNGQPEESTTTLPVYVYKRKIVLIADRTAPNKELERLRQIAVDNGVLLKILQPSASSVPLGGEEDGFFNVVSDQRKALSNADAVIIWNDGISGLQALLRASQADRVEGGSMNNQTLLLVTNHGMSTLARASRGPLNYLTPRQTIVTRPEAIESLLKAADTRGFQESIEQRGIEQLFVTPASMQTNVWDVLSALVNYMLTHGISSQTVLLLLMLPVIATILAFLKQVIGLTTFGLYTPSIVALSFMALGWWIGIVFLLFIIATGYFTRSMMKRWRLLYIPKVAIILTVVSITLLLLLGLGTSLGIALSRDTVFILLIMSTLAETFLNLKTEEGLNAALLGIGETIFSSLLCVAIVQAPLFQLLILAYPELILLTIVINAFLGRWTGLRLLEYFRFKEVFKHMKEEE
jgi:7 transmembrane helices usually fused to an inactive transglutaminase